MFDVPFYEAMHGTKRVLNEYKASSSVYREVVDPSQSKLKLCFDCPMQENWCLRHVGAGAPRQERVVVAELGPFDFFKATTHQIADLLAQATALVVEGWEGVRTAGVSPSTVLLFRY